MKRILSIIVILLCVVSAKAATTLVTNLNWIGIATAISNATSGDTLLLTNGTGYVTNYLSFQNKDLVIQGAGSYDWVTNAVNTNGFLTNYTGLETILIDESPTRSWATMFAMGPTNLNFTNRLTGIRLKGGTTNTSEANFGLIVLTASNNESNNAPWRIDHCYFDNPKGRPLYAYAWGGLFDHNVVMQGGLSGIIVDGRIGTSKGDRSWATPVQWGTVDAGLYFEHNFFSNTVNRAIIDAYAGARYVFRFNTVYNLSVENHGTESTQRPRGGRSVEAYGNTLVNPAAGAEYAFYYRSGSGRIFSNSVSGNYPGFLRLECDRMTDWFTPWRGAVGTNAWDNNDPTLYESGSHSGTSGATVLTDGTKSWTVNQWVGYSIINERNGYGGVISANTATTITLKSPNFSWSQVYWTNADNYEIRKVIKALDQPGAGSGDLLSGGSDTVNPTPTTWPNQVDEPFYYWNNTGISSVSASGEYNIQAGRDYTNAAPSGYTLLADPHPFALIDDTNALAGASISPTSVSVLTNTATTFTATITTGIPAFYQWTLENTNVTGANGSTYSPSLPSAGTYSVNFWATNSYGPNLTNGSASTLTVTNGVGGGEIPPITSSSGVKMPFRRTY